MKPFFVSARPFLVGALLSVTASIHAKDLSLIRSDLTATGTDSSASGVARASFTPNNPKFRLDLFKLTPNETYQLAIDGVLVETFETNTRGSANLDFRVSPSSSKLALDFDPRGAVVSILDEEGEVLSTVFSGDGEPDDIRVDERSTLLPLSEEDSGRVELRYLEQKNKDRFIVHFLGLDRGTYELYVDGQLQAEIDLNRGRSTMRSFELLKNGKAKPGNGNGNGKGGSKKLALNFDPREKVVDVVRDGEIIFSGIMLANIPGLEPQAGEANLTLTSTGADVDATGSALLALAPDGTLSLTVDVSGLAAGSYDVVISGQARGTIVVTGAEPDGNANIVFSTSPGAGEFLLDFDVFGETLEISQADTIYFNGTLPLTLAEIPLPESVETELPLLNIGDLETASAHITLTTTGETLDAVEVDLTGVPVGNYDFRVGTEVRGTIVVSESNGLVSGEIIFGAEGLPLDFDPRGQTVTIEQTGTVLLSRPLL